MAAARDEQNFAIHLLGRCVGFFINTSLWLLLALVLSIVIEWAGMIFDFWSMEHSQDMLNKELRYLGGIENTVYGIPASTLALTFVSVVESWNINGLLTWSAGLPNLIFIAIASAINIFLLFVVRLAVIVCAIPAVLLIAIVALIDGLVERDIRRACGDVESSFIYHFAKPWVAPSLALSVAVYLTMPFSLNPAYVFAPAMTLMALSIYIAVSKFKLFA